MISTSSVTAYQLSDERAPSGLCVFPALAHTELSGIRIILGLNSEIPTELASLDGWVVVER